MKLFNFRVLAVIIFFSSLSSLLGQNPTPNYYKCLNRVSGSWNFGRAPYGCDAASFGEDEFVYKNYVPILYNVSSDLYNNSSEYSGYAEVYRYMDNLFPAIKDIAHYYFLQRNPDVSEDEIEAWQQAVLTVANQESYWSHYRIASDQRLKMIRGDYGHGHGIMQVDDRYHFSAINQGIGWDLVNNFIYAMEIYFNAWQRALNASCLTSATNWLERSRSAYSAYNGGPSKICRWTNPNDKWAANDKAFLNNYLSKRWENYIINFDKSSEVDVVCLAEGNSDCPSNGDGSDDGNLDVSEKRIILEDNRTCVLKEQNSLHCVTDQRDVLCLFSITSFDPQLSVHLSKNDYSEWEIQTYDRHQICSKLNVGLLPVSTAIKLQKNINIRAVPGGGLLGAASLGSVYQILDFEVRDNNSFSRYYLVKKENVQGYIYAGNQTDYQQWVIKSEEPLEDENVVIPTVQDRIKIVAKWGINLRTTPGGELISRVSKNAVEIVKDLKIIGDSNRVYYSIVHNDQSGFIYGGRVLPDMSLSSWAQYQIQDEKEIIRGVAADNFWYLYLKMCPSESCLETSNYLIGGKWEQYCKYYSNCTYKRDEMTLLESTADGWRKVIINRSNQRGWVQQEYIVMF